MRMVWTAPLLFAIACRADPGTGDYSSHVGLRDSAMGDEFLLGPTPFVPGVPRLSVGLFYENAFTDQVVINGVDTFYFIFDTVGDGSGTLTFTQETDSDRVEGSISDRIIHAGTGFWGGGIFWYTARDLSRFTTLNLSLKSSDDAFQDISINVQSGPDRPMNGPDSTSDTTVSAASYGYVNDGEWHSLTIPFEDFVNRGFDPTSARSPLFFNGGAGQSGESFLVDDVYVQ